MFNKLEKEIERRIRETVGCFGKDIRVGATFDRDSFSIKVYTIDNEYSISVQYRGTDIEKYTEPLMGIISRELTKQ